MAKQTQFVKFRIFAMPCCGTLICWVNPRLPNHCPECGKFVYAKLRIAVPLYQDDDAKLISERQ